MAEITKLLSEKAGVPLVQLTTKCFVGLPSQQGFAGMQRRLLSIGNLGYSLLISESNQSIAISNLNNINLTWITATINMRLQAMGVPETISILTMYKPQIVKEVTWGDSWIVSSWSSCSTDCGWGTRFRNASCAGGNDMFCIGGVERPNQGEECHATCPFDALCPFGPETSFACASQRGLFASLIALGVLCVCCCISYRICKHLCRPAKEGSITIRDDARTVAIKAKYTIYMRKDLKKSASTLAAHQEKDSPKGSKHKTHIIWDTKAEHVQVFFDAEIERHPSNGSLNGRVSSKGSAASRRPSESERRPSKNSISSRLSRLSVRMSRRSSQGSDIPRPLDPIVDILENIEPTALSDEAFVMKVAYRDGADVQYFSLTHMRWLAGVMRVRRTAPTYIRYDVELSGGQERLDVMLNHLRPAIEWNEPLEVFRKSSGAGWTWAPCRLTGSEKRVVSSWVGYSVEVEDGPIIEHVSAARLRRKFAPGTFVIVYLGVRAGFTCARVDRYATDVEALTLGRDDIIKLERVGQELCATASSRTLVLRELRDLVSYDLDMGRFEKIPSPWTWVLITFHSSTELPHHQEMWVPTFLLSIRSAEI